jgi:hypothetical protein
VKATAVSLWFISINLAAITGWLQMRWPWWRFLGAQVFQVEAMIAGWFVLAPFCLMRAWTLSSLAGSNKDGRPVDHWNTRWVRFLYDNPEDGVSGAQALIWTADGRQVSYLPNAWAPWRAYLWSGWRNSADALKYRFAWKGGPFRRWQWRGYHLQLGWNSSGLPVVSAGR